MTLYATPDGRTANLSRAEALQIIEDFRPVAAALPERQRPEDRYPLLYVDGYGPAGATFGVAEQSYFSGDFKRVRRECAPGEHLALLVGLRVEVVSAAKHALPDALTLWLHKEGYRLDEGGCICQAPEGWSPPARLPLFGDDPLL